MPHFTYKTLGLEVCLYIFWQRYITNLLLHFFGSFEQSTCLKPVLFWSKIIPIMNCYLKVTEGGRKVNALARHIYLLIPRNGQVWCEKIKYDMKDQFPLSVWGNLPPDPWDNVRISNHGQVNIGVFLQTWAFSAIQSFALIKMSEYVHCISVRFSNSIFHFQECLTEQSPIIWSYSVVTLL